MKKTQSPSESIIFLGLNELNWVNYTTSDCLTVLKSFVGQNDLHCRIFSTGQRHEHEPHYHGWKHFPWAPCGVKQWALLKHQA